MSKQKESEEEVERLLELLNKAILEHFDERVVPAAKGYVEIFETKLNQFNWADDEDKLDEIATEFAKEYEKLELKLFDEFDKKVFDRIFPQSSKPSSDYRKYLKEKINNYLNNTAAEPLERILEYVKNTN
jgi:hypothetical protein